MSEYQEFEGKTIDKALESASRELGIPLEALQYDVVSHGSTGIFGLVGAKKAKIRIKSQGDTSPLSGDLHEQAKERARDLVKNAFQLDEQDQAEDVPAHFDEAITIGQDTIKRITEFISEGVIIDTKVQKERLVFRISSEKSGLLIGKRGQTLEAIQYLVDKIINKKCEQRVRVLVDVEGYLETRKNNLKKLAGRMADKAQKINKPVTIGQMNAYDRRIVHLHLKDNHAVRTQSVGEGYYRKLVIFPKKRRRNRSNS